MWTNLTKYEKKKLKLIFLHNISDTLRKQNGNDLIGFSCLTTKEINAPNVALLSATTFLVFDHDAPENE